MSVNGKIMIVPIKLPATHHVHTSQICANKVTQRFVKLKGCFLVASPNSLSTTQFFLKIFQKLLLPPST